MNILKTLHFFSGVLFLLSITGSSASAQNAVKRMDVIRDSTCTGCTALRDLVTNQQITLSSTNSFTVSGSNTWQPIGGGMHLFDLSTRNAFDTSWTVALTLAPAQASLENVMSLTDASDRVLFTLMRDNHQRWYFAKVPDGVQPPGQLYLQKTWDPVSPCSTSTACDHQTIYVTFHRNGQIELDEFATLSTGPTGMDWESGLLNFGYPVRSYRAGSAVGNPTQFPDFFPVRWLRLYDLSASDMRDPKPAAGVYPAAALRRVTLWTDDALGRPGLIQNEINTQRIPSGDLNWMPCSTGRYEQAGPDDAPPLTTRQYDPSDIGTPCQLPKPPVDATGSVSTTMANISWKAPFYFGSSPVTGYQVKYSIPRGEQIPVDVPATATSTKIFNLEPQSPYSFDVYSLAATGRTAAPRFELTTGVDAGPPGFTFCANQNQRCSFSGPGVVAYGQYGVFRYVATIGGAFCDDVQFGNPASGGNPNKCWYSTSASLPNGPAGFAYCSSEWETCSVSGSAIVAFGVNGSYFYRTVSADIPCNYNRFGDPAPGAGKFCFVAPAGVVPSAPSGFTFCSGQYDRCGVGTDSIVAYGASGKYNYASQPSGTWQSCTNSTFGDPLPYSDKQCFSISKTDFPAQAPAFVACASENQTCSFAGKVGTVAYGANGLYLFKRASGSISCSSSAFGGDPASGASKRCYFDEEPASSSLPGFTFCAAEGQSCSPSGPALIAFGANGQFSYKQFPNGTTCSSSSFGGANPASGTARVCLASVTPALNPPEWVQCATEGQTCTVSGTREVALGGAGSYHYKTVTGSIACGVSQFGDPAPSYPKTCYSSIAVPPAGGPSGFTKCAVEGSSCMFQGEALVAYGSGGIFHYFTYRDGVPCRESEFGKVYSDGAKACYYRDSANFPTPPQGMTYCASEGGTCAVAGSATVAFGVNGMFYFRDAAESIACNTATFGDPAPGSGKSCFWAPATSFPAGPEGFRTCAPENGQCLINGSVSVAFGRNGLYQYHSASSSTGMGQLLCNVDPSVGWNDPAPGGFKACFLKPASEYPVGPSQPGYAFCAKEGGYCSFAGAATIQFGGSGSFSSKTVTGGIACTANAFGAGNGSGRACFYKAATP